MQPFFLENVFWLPGLARFQQNRTSHPALRWCVVTPQNSFCYRILKQEIEIITITDTQTEP